MRRFGTILVTLLILGALGAVGYGVFQSGYQQGLVESGAEVVTPVVGYYPGLLGLGLFGLVFKVFFLLLIIGLVSRFFFWRRGWRGGPWGKGGWHGEEGEHPMEKRLGEWHERAHGREPPSGGRGSTV